MDLREIKLAQLNRQSILSNVVEPSFFTTADEREQQPNNNNDDGDVEQSSSPSQNGVTNVNDFTSETLGTAQYHNRLTNTTRDQQLNNNNNSHKPHKPQSTANQYNVSIGSLELQKRVIKHCFVEMFQSLNSDKHDDEETDVIIPPNDLRDDYNQEQKSMLTSISTACFSRKVLPHTPLEISTTTTECNTTTTIVSTPGAYMMRGASVTGRAQIGMITPSEQRQNELTENLNDCENQESKIIIQQFLSSQIFPNKKKGRRRIWCIGVSIIVLVMISIAVVVLKNKKQISNNNEMKKLNWSDFLEECSSHGTIDQSMIDPTLISTFEAVTRHYMLNDGHQHQVKRCSPQSLALWSIALSLDPSLIQHDNTMNVKKDGHTNSTSSLPPSFIPSLSDARYVLSVFFFSLGGSQWNKHFNWLSSSNECDWFGIECSSKNEEDGQQDREVLTIDLNLNNLNGTIPMEFYRLTSIQYLVLNDNIDIRGTISKEIENLSSLTSLILFETSLSGPLPSELFSLPSLSTMLLSDTTPPSSTPISYLGLLSKLTYLEITSNVLGGSIPTEIGLLTKLTHLNIFGSLRGKIPAELENLNLMEKIMIGSGSLSGSLPDRLFENNKNWKRITISENHLTGTIPSLIGTQQQLQDLELFENGLSGSIPSEIGRCSRLRNLDLEENRLGGTIPTEIGMMNSLTTLTLNFNELTGTVPTEIAKLENLKMIKLPGCQGLLGAIPPVDCEGPIVVDVNREFCTFTDSLWESCLRLSCCSSSR